jgi:hypothetical protein
VDFVVVNRNLHYLLVVVIDIKDVVVVDLKNHQVNQIYLLPLYFLMVIPSLKKFVVVYLSLEYFIISLKLSFEQEQKGHQNQENLKFFYFMVFFNF